MIELDEKEMKEITERCSYGNVHSLIPMHSCPYASEIGGNDDPEYCNCCDECMQNCIDDI